MKTTGPGRTALVLAIAIVTSAPGCSRRANESLSESSGTNAPMLIEPDVSVGKLRAGITVQQAVAELGEPQRRTAHALEYALLGLALLPDQDGVVQFVMCGDVTGINGPFVKAFTGHTKEGIGMRSTRAEVIKAYGEPTSDQKFWGGFESMKYDPLGVTFTLDGGKVCHMAVRLLGPLEPNKSVTVDIVPKPRPK